MMIHSQTLEEMTNEGRLPLQKGEGEWHKDTIRHVLKTPCVGKREEGVFLRLSMNPNYGYFG